MAGKEGMTKRDIYRKLDSFKTDDGKIQYLYSLEPKANVLNPSTRKAFYEILGDLTNHPGYYEKAGMKDKAKLVRDKTGWEKRANRTEEAGDFSAAANYYDEAGMEQKAKEMWKKDGDFQAKIGNFSAAASDYERVGMEQKAKEMWKKDGDKWAKAGYFDNAAKAYEEAREKDMAGKMWEKAGDIATKNYKFDSACTYYENAGFKKSNNVKILGKLAKTYEDARRPQETMSLHRKITNLEKKKQKDNPSLEDRTHLLAIVGGSFLASLLFFSANGITGNVVSNSSVKPGNVIGLGLFILGLIAAFFYFKK
ncbi:MAG: hypothetical protein NTZ83_05685 [Candidatus Pacearchaeota archaeon]|nr:hypothetical protein [Candidatus Pacearchaeota archaeon]